MSADKHWLEKPATVDRIVYGLYTVCGLMLLADFLYHKHPYFGFDGWLGFYGWYGFVACVALVLAAKLMRKLVIRPEDYYESRRAPADRAAETAETHDAH